MGIATVTLPNASLTATGEGLPDMLNAPSPETIETMGDASLAIHYERALTVARLLLRLHYDQEQTISLIDRTVMPFEQELERRGLIDEHGNLDVEAVPAA